MYLLLGKSVQEITATRSPESNASPWFTRRVEILPDFGAEITVSIFIALRTAIGSPSVTKSPVVLRTSTTRPFMEHAICPSFVKSAFSLLLAVSTSPVLSRTSNEFYNPLTSKKTLLLPSSSA
jgi:hypothetical protein